MSGTTTKSSLLENLEVLEQFSRVKMTREKRSPLKNCIQMQKDFAHRELGAAALIQELSPDNVMPIFDCGQAAGTDDYFLVMPAADQNLQKKLMMIKLFQNRKRSPFSNKLHLDYPRLVTLFIGILNRTIFFCMKMYGKLRITASQNLLRNQPLHKPLKNV